MMRCPALYSKKLRTFSPFRLNDRLIDPSLNRVVLTSGETVQVEPKIMQVLVALAEHQGEVVTREELMARVWNGVFVTDDALHRAIRELRRLFDDEADAPRVIETIRKRGYRLVAAVELVESRPFSPLDSKPAETVADGRPPYYLVGIGLIAVGVAMFIWLGRRPAAVDTDARVRFLPLTSDPGNEVDPALSTSGRLAYVARAADGRPHLFTKSSADAPAVQTTHGDGADHAPAWSPDESQLAFVRIDASGCAIWIAAADGREARTLVPCTARDEFRMSWSPDSGLLAVTAGAATIRTPSHIEVISIATGARRAVTEPPPAHSGDWSPAFSPNGREIAFVRSISGSISDVFVVPTDGGVPRRITTDNADVLGVDWEPDGRQLVFSSDRAGGISVWRVSTDGGEPTLLAGGGAKLKHPTVARRTGVVAYEDWQYEINLRDQPTVEDEAQTAASISATSDRWNFHPQISPDGRRLVFQSTRSGQYELWLSDRNGQNPRPLTRSAVYKSPARWSPDSRHIVFATRSGGTTDIATLDVDTGAMRPIVSERSAAVATVWSADGSSIYYGSLRSGTWQIWKVDASGGPARQVTADGGYAAMQSNDGRLLYVARLDRVGLWRRPVEGGPEMLVADRVLAEQWPNWGVSDRGIYYVTWSDDGDPSVAILEDGAATPRMLGRLEEYAWTGIALTRDAGRVIYARADRRAAIIGALRMEK
jgi:Tol biopolymer transport system component/DNA-binding winged helix-turn-helix (wHTH) protein